MNLTAPDPAAVAWLESEHFADRRMTAGGVFTRRRMFDLIEDHADHPDEGSVCGWCYIAADLGSLIVADGKADR